MAVQLGCSFGFGHLGFHGLRVFEFKVWGVGCSE